MEMQASAAGRLGRMQSCTNPCTSKNHVRSFCNDLKHQAHRMGDWDMAERANPRHMAI